MKQDEWTGEQKLQYTDVPEDIEPEEIQPMGNYAVQISWPDGFNQVYDFSISSIIKLHFMKKLTIFLYLLNYSAE